MGSTHSKPPSGESLILFSASALPHRSIAASGLTFRAKLHLARQGRTASSSACNWSLAPVSPAYRQVSASATGWTDCPPMRPAQGFPDVHAMEVLPGEPVIIRPVAPMRSLIYGQDEHVPHPSGVPQPPWRLPPATPGQDARHTTPLTAFPRPSVGLMPRSAPPAPAAAHRHAG
jgi:hypothetical protein